MKGLSTLRAVMYPMGLQLNADFCGLMYEHDLEHKKALAYCVYFCSLVLRIISARSRMCTWSCVLHFAAVLSLVQGVLNGVRGTGGL